MIAKERINRIRLHWVHSNENFWYGYTNSSVIAAGSSYIAIVQRKPLVFGNHPSILSLNKKYFWCTELNCVWLGGREGENARLSDAKLRAEIAVTRWCNKYGLKPKLNIELIKCQM